MAEFKEVLRHRNRMCKAHKSCADCPLKRWGNSGECLLPKEGTENEYESIVMKWASEHPELTFPTWEELQNEYFPDARFPITLCHFIKGSNCPRPMNPLLGSCKECRKLPIPADIAERLGVKPKGEKELPEEEEPVYEDCYEEWLAERR